MAAPQGLSLVNLAAEIKVSKLYQLNCGHLLCHLQYAATRVVTKEKASFFVFIIAVWFGDRCEERVRVRQAIASRIGSKSLSNRQLTERRFHRGSAQLRTSRSDSAR